MTAKEQKQIIQTLEALGNDASIAISKRTEQWAEDMFRPNANHPSLGDRGIAVQYRTNTVNEWIQLKYIPFSRVSWESHDSRNTRLDATKTIFHFANQRCSNQMGDVTELRYLPYISVDGKTMFKEDEETIIQCTDTKKRRKWNYLEFVIRDEPHWGSYEYHLIKKDIHVGDNICWYQAWHFSLGDDVECPVEPIIVEQMDDYQIVLRYKGQLYTLSMELDKPHSARLVEHVHIQPTHNWDSIWRRPPFQFSLIATLSWNSFDPQTSDKQIFQNKPHFTRTSDLPAGVRTREQIDHDAWEEGVRSGQIGRK